MSDVAGVVGARMVDHSLSCAQGIIDVLEHEDAEEFLCNNPEKVEELQRLLKRADASLNRVRLLDLWRKKQPPE